MTDTPKVPKYQEVKQLVEAVRVAHEQYLIAVDAVSRASREEIYAINRLNAAQQKLDEALDTLREQAPTQSDWYNVIRDARTRGR